MQGGDRGRETVHGCREFGDGSEDPFTFRGLGSHTSQPMQKKRFPCAITATSTTHVHVPWVFGFPA